MRTAPQRVAETEIDDHQINQETRRWATLREASRATGIPVETLRKWARRTTIPSFLTPTATGTNIRMVDLDGVEQRAAELGRTISAEPETPVASSVPPPPADPTPAPPAPTGADAPLVSAEVTPPGTMIVPIDAWNKMLNQLGNLHEAGQQLAVARERAAKAETEAKFLRDRLAEIRREPLPPAATPISHEPPPAPPSEPPATPPEKVWQYLVRRVRDRRSGAH